MRRWFLVASMIVVGSIACGGGMAPEVQKSVTPTSPSGGANDVENTTHTNAPQSVPTDARPQSTAGTYARPPSRERVDFERAEQQLNASIGDCATACRALASMESAASHLCELDAGECSAAQQRLAAARDRVERACGKCR